jgi:hypothetical protein
MTNTALTETRKSLLEYYTSKSNNQTIIILTGAIVFFTACQVVIALVGESFSKTIIGIVIIVVLFSWIFIRQMGRLMMWSALSSIILNVGTVDEKETSNALTEEQKYGIPLDSSNDIWRLHYSCCKLARTHESKDNSWGWKILRWTDNKIFLNQYFQMIQNQK